MLPLDPLRQSSVATPAGTMPVAGLGTAVPPFGEAPVASSVLEPGAPPGDPRQAAIDTGLLEIFLRGSVFRQRIGATLFLLFTAFCWRTNDAAPLLIWLFCGLAVIVFRNRVERRFARAGVIHDVALRGEFLDTMHRIYVVHGGIWGLSLVFCFGQLPVYDQMGCLLVLACVASGPLTTVALVPRLLKAYTNPLFLVMIATMVGMTLARHGPASHPNYLLLSLPLFYWWLLGRFGRGILQNQTEQLGLQYDIAQKEREARAAVQTKDRFLAAAAHDLRQPVMALSLYAEHLVAHPEMHLELAPKIALASHSVKALFEALFDLATLDSGRVALQVRLLSVKDAMEALRVQFEPLATAKNISLRLRCADAELLSDPVRLQRMVGNVLGNAIKYTPPGRKILLAARARAGGAVRIEVWDQGLGIPARDIDKVFDEFYRVDRPDAPAADGVGLGLSIVLRIARVLRTRVAIRSVVGRGTRFTLDVSPMASDEDAEPSARSAGAA